MHPVESTYNLSAIEMTTNAGGVVAEAGRRPRHGNTSSANAAGVETSRTHYGWQGERRQAGKRADADTCRSLICFPEMSVIKQWWTSWRLLKSGNSFPNGWRDDGGTEADSGAGSGGIGHISFLSFLFSFLSCFGLALNFHLSAGMKGS